MLKYKINIADALERVGFGTYDAKKTGFISQETLKKFKAEDTKVALESLNRLCVLLDMDLKDIIVWEMSEEDKKQREQLISGLSRNKRNNGINLKN